MHWVRTNISSIYYFTEIPITLKQHIQSDWITNEPRKPWGDVLRTLRWTDGQTDRKYHSLSCLIAARNDKSHWHMVKDNIWWWKKKSVSIHVGEDIICFIVWYWHTEIPIILKLHIQSDWITNADGWMDGWTDGQTDRVKPEWTCDAGWTRDGHGKEGRTDEPIYPPTTSLCKGYNHETFKMHDCHHYYCCCVILIIVILFDRKYHDYMMIETKIVEHYVKLGWGD